MMNNSQDEAAPIPCLLILIICGIKTLHEQRLGVSIDEKRMGGKEMRGSFVAVQSVKVADTSTMLVSVYVMKNACCER